MQTSSCRPFSRPYSNKGSTRYSIAAAIATGLDFGVQFATWPGRRPQHFEPRCDKKKFTLVLKGYCQNVKSSTVLVRLLYKVISRMQLEGRATVSKLEVWVRFPPSARNFSAVHWGDFKCQFCLRRSEQSSSAT